jgi:ATP phosphoribosyltransferase
MNGRLRVALPKGRLFDQSIDLLSRAGISVDAGDGSRKLMFTDTAGEIDFVALKPVDVPVYVESGAMDAGIVGSDILREMESDVYEPLDLRIGLCRLVLAAPNDAPLSYDRYLQIATKYPRTAERFFRSRNAHVHIVRLDGSVEIAPLLNLADAIVDLVETGRTLRENGMRVAEEIAQVSAKLIVNRTSMKMKASAISKLVAQLDAVIYANP